MDQTTVRQGRGNQNIYELKMIFCIYFILLLTQLFVHSIIFNTQSLVIIFLRGDNPQIGL